MITPSFSTIAQLVYADTQPLNFARIVGDLQAIMTRFRGDELRVQWDCEDIAFFDLPDTRIAMAWDDAPGKGHSACLTVSVGPNPDTQQLSATGHEEMCSRLVERLQARYPSTATLWHQTTEPVGAELIDTLVDDLPSLMELFPFQEPEWVAPVLASASPSAAVEHAMQSIERATVARARVHAAAANHTPDLPLPRNAELARIRDALYAPVDGDVRLEKPSAQMRLAVHTMNATLILVWAPLGVAVMTHALLRGEDMRTSSRWMVMTGMVLGLAQTPMGLQVAAMASVLTG